MDHFIIGMLVYFCFGIRHSVLNEVRPLTPEDEETVDEGFVRDPFRGETYIPAVAVDENERLL